MHLNASELCGKVRNNCTAMQRYARYWSGQGLLLVNYQSTGTGLNAMQCNARAELTTQKCYVPPMLTISTNISTYANMSHSNANDPKPPMCPIVSSHIVDSLLNWFYGFVLNLKLYFMVLYLYFAEGKYESHRAGKSVTSHILTNVTFSTCAIFISLFWAFLAVLPALLSKWWKDCGEAEPAMVLRFSWGTK